MDSQIVRCARYARISLDRAGDEHGVANQLADQQRAADTKGFVIVRTEVDNDISALNGKHRPGYEAVMAAAARGEIDVILVSRPPVSGATGGSGPRGSRFSAGPGYP